MGNVPTINAIPTQYKGIEFRSRTEARWAVFLTELGIEWEYEPEGYQLLSGWYLPDFWLPQIDAFLEVKPDWVKTEDRWLDLAASTGKRLFVTAGAPGASQPFWANALPSVGLVGYGPWDPGDFQEFFQTFFGDFEEPMPEEDAHRGRIKAYGQSGYILDESPFYFSKCPLCKKWSVVTDRWLKRNHYSCDHKRGIDYIDTGAGVKATAFAASAAANYRFWNPGGAV